MQPPKKHFITGKNEICTIGTNIMNSNAVLTFCHIGTNEMIKYCRMLTELLELLCGMTTRQDEEI